MTEESPARPLLAIAICSYEIVIVLLAIVGRSFDHWLRVAHPIALSSDTVSSNSSLRTQLRSGSLCRDFALANAPFSLSSTRDSRCHLSR